MKRSRSGDLAQQDAGKILFYSVRSSPFGCFSNFSPHAITIDGRRYPTTEHYFQAHKFVGSPRDFEFVVAQKTPAGAASAGRDRARPLRKDWEKVKDALMYRACAAKFTQHPPIQEVLLKTGSAELVEHTARDSYWGDGGDGSGKNMLGKTLMRVRSEIRAARAPKGDAGCGSADPPSEPSAAAGAADAGIAAVGVVPGLSAVAASRKST